MHVGKTNDNRIHISCLINETRVFKIIILAAFLKLVMCVGEWEGTINGEDECEGECGGGDGNNKNDDANERVAVCMCMCARVYVHACGSHLQQPALVC